MAVTAVVTVLVVVAPEAYIVGATAPGDEVVIAGTFAVEVTYPVTTVFAVTVVTCPELVVV